MRIKSFAALLALFGFVCSASAALVAEDSRFGDNTLIRDTNTGLEWLRLDVTAGMSFLDVVAQTAEGGYLSGFQLAGINNVFSLYANEVLPLGVDLYLQPTSNPAAVYSALSFSQLFGGQVSHLSDGSVAGSLIGMMGPYIPGWGCQASGCSVETTIMGWELRSSGISAYVTLDYIGRPGGVDPATIGTWLVAAPVPEPSTYALVFAGLFLVVARRWSVRAAQ